MAGFTIGDFKAGPNNTTRKAAKAATTTPPVDADEVKVADPEADPAPVKTPAEQYKERLAEAGISEAEANAVFDDLITKGYYQETVTIRGRKAVLRTRTYEDHARTLGAIELQSPRFQATQEEIQARYNLAASLVEWNGTVYKQGKDVDKEFQTTMDAVRRLPTPVYSMLIGALVKFDARMFVIFSDGAAESF